MADSGGGAGDVTRAGTWRRRDEEEETWKRRRRLAVLIGCTAVLSVYVIAVHRSENIFSPSLLCDSDCMERFQLVPNTYQWLYPQASNAVPVFPMQFAEPEDFTGYGMSPLKSSFAVQPGVVTVPVQRVVVPGPQMIVKTIRKMNHNWGTRRHDDYVGHVFKEYRPYPAWRSHWGTRKHQDYIDDVYSKGYRPYPQWKRHWGTRSHGDFVDDVYGRPFVSWDMPYGVNPPEVARFPQDVSHEVSRTANLSAAGTNQSTWPPVDLGVRAGERGGTFKEEWMAPKESTKIPLRRGEQGSNNYRMSWRDYISSYGGDRSDLDKVRVRLMQDALDRLRNKIEVRGLKESSGGDGEDKAADGQWAWLPGKTEEEANKYGGYWAIVPDKDVKGKGKAEQPAESTQGRKEDVRAMKEDGYWEVVPD